jgi:hypothetical protein
MQLTRFDQLETGMRVSFTKRGFDTAEGMIVVEGRSAFIVSNEPFMGGSCPREMHGYIYGWNITRYGRNEEDWNGNDIFNLETVDAEATTAVEPKVDIKRGDKLVKVLFKRGKDGNTSMKIWLHKGVQDALCVSGSSSVRSIYGVRQEGDKRYRKRNVTNTDFRTPQKVCRLGSLDSGLNYFEGRNMSILRIEEITKDGGETFNIGNRYTKDDLERFSKNMGEMVNFIYNFMMKPVSIEMTVKAN